MNTETIFKVGDKVFDINRGWSVVRRIDYDPNYPILLENSMMYTSDGKRFANDKNLALSFTEYTFEGFSQERPKEPLPFNEGDVVYVADDMNGCWLTAELYKIDLNSIQLCFVIENTGRYSFLAIENPLLNRKTKIYTIKDL